MRSSIDAIYVILLDYDYGFMCIILGLMHGYSDLTMWVYDGHIDDYMVVYRMT